MRPKRLARCGMTLATAAATLLMGAAPALAAVQQRGGAENPGGDPGYTPLPGITQKWVYRDDENGGFGSAGDNASLEAAFRQIGTRFDDSAGIASAALAGAKRKCDDGFDRRHPDEAGGSQCRLVGVGAAYGSGGWNGHAHMDTSVWRQNWNSEVANSTYSNHGAKYTTANTFWDQPGVSVNSLAKEGVSDTAAIVVIVLDQYEPVPADVAPAPPSKDIQKGVSADAMVNHTTIGTGTGVNGKHMTMRDTFHPNGQKYTVSNQRVTDATTGGDITSRFTANTPDGSTPPGGVATMTWNGGDLPKDHTWHWDLDVTAGIR